MEYLGVHYIESYTVSQQSIVERDLQPLLAEEEKTLVEWIIYCAERGFSVTKTHLLNCIQKFLNDNQKETLFKNNRPGKFWYRVFMRRHNNLSERIAQNLTTIRASETEEDLRQWFSYIKNHLEKKILLSLEPHRIFNLDESAFMLVPRDNCVIAEKGSKSVYQITDNDKACLTVLFNASASGKLTPSMILFSLKKPPNKTILNKIPKGWGIAHSDQGWMTAETFYSYLTYFLNGYKR